MLFLFLPASLFFFFTDTATTEIYTLSLHDALPILGVHRKAERQSPFQRRGVFQLLTLLHPVDPGRRFGPDRKSTRLNSSHSQISYAVFCLKKKKKYLSTRRLIP